jgi:hypothetical protein
MVMTKPAITSIIVIVINKKNAEFVKLAEVVNKIMQTNATTVERP